MRRKQLRQSWINLTVIAICVATFLSDVSHETATAVLPLYFASVGLGPHVLGWMEGVANFTLNVGRLAGGLMGQLTRRKKYFAAAGYIVTTLATVALAFTVRPIFLTSFRAIAWFARGFRGPLRDYLLSQAVPKAYYGRAFGLERTGDMLGAVAGPLLALFLLWMGWAYPSVILFGAVPGLMAAALVWLGVQEKASQPLEDPIDPGGESLSTSGERYRPTGAFISYLLAVGVFSLGSYSRLFLVVLVIQALGARGEATPGTLSLPVILYLILNAVSSLAPYPAGVIADRTSRLGVLAFGYGLLTVATFLAALFSSNLWLLAVAMILSGIELGIEEAMEKAVVAELVPLQWRNLGFGLVGFTTAVGQLAASLYVGYLFHLSAPSLALGVAGLFSSVGTVWITVLTVTSRRMLPRFGEKAE